MLLSLSLTATPGLQLNHCILPLMHVATTLNLMHDILFLVKSQNLPHLLLISIANYVMHIQHINYQIWNLQQTDNFAPRNQA